MDKPGYYGYWLAIAFSLTCGNGCSQGERVYPVIGRVLFEDGAPADTGMIEFRSVELGINARAKIQKDGSFQLTTYRPFDGAIAGKHQAIIVQHIITEVPAPQKHVPNPGKNLQPLVHRAHKIVAKKYSNYDSTTLEFIVEPIDNNVFDVKVEQ